MVLFIWAWRQIVHPATLLAPPSSYLDDVSAKSWVWYSGTLQNRLLTKASTFGLSSFDRRAFRFRLRDEFKLVFEFRRTHLTYLICLAVKTVFRTFLTLMKRPGTRVELWAMNLGPVRFSAFVFIGKERLCAGSVRLGIDTDFEVSSFTSSFGMGASIFSSILVATLCGNSFCRVCAGWKQGLGGEGVGWK